MKIMIFNALYYPYRVGGAEISVQLLAEELVRQGNKVCVVTLGESQSREKRFINGVDVISLPLKNVYWPYSEKRSLLLRKFFGICWTYIIYSCIAK